MRQNENASELRDCLERVSLKLTALHSTLCTTALGLQAEGTEEQVLHVFQCLESSVNDIRNTVSECIDGKENEDIPP